MSINLWPPNREPYHGDIVQGQLGNCFLIASLQALASCQPHLLKSVVSVSPLACFFHRQGERVEISVLIEPVSDEYRYCRSTLPDVQWPYVIEQAYAQFYGGRYDNLAGGNTSEALYDLIGKPVIEYEPNDNQTWENIEKGLIEKTALVTCGAVAPNQTTTASSTSAFANTSIGGYGELHYNNIKNNNGDDKKEIDFHRFVLFIGHEFSDKLRFFSEFELEHSLAGEGKNGEVELEQAYVEYDYSDAITAKVGLFLVIIFYLFSVRWKPFASLLVRIRRPQ